MYTFWEYPLHKDPKNVPEHTYFSLYVHMHVTTNSQNSNHKPEYLQDQMVNLILQHHKPCQPENNSNMLLKGKNTSVNLRILYTLCVKSMAIQDLWTRGFWVVTGCNKDATTGCRVHKSLYCHAHQTKFTESSFVGCMRYVATDPHSFLASSTIASYVQYLWRHGP